MTLCRPDGVTIGIPNWNHRNFLPRSLRSAVAAAKLLNSKGVACQVLVVDDHSRDGSQRYLFNTAMQAAIDLDCIFLETNAGLGPARNTLLARARYNSVCVMDADNELVPENLFLFWRALHETGAAIVYGNLLIKERGRIMGLMSNDFVHEEVYRLNYIDAFSLLNSDRVNFLGGYYGRHAPAHEDWELLLHLISEGEDIVFVPLVLGYYNVEQLSMIRTTDSDHSKIHRSFAQRGTGFPSTFRPRRIYHPEVGWL